MASSDSLPFKDKCVLITGAGRGIGKRLAIGFAAEGARVGLLARTQAELDATKFEIEQTPSPSTLRLRGDVRNPEQMEIAVDRLSAALGPIHVLIACAAIQGPVAPFIETRLAQWRETFDTNLLGVMNSCHAVLPSMIGRRSGKIIVLTGDGVSVGRPNFSPYAAACSAVARFVECVAEEVREHNVQINCFNPGGTYTVMTDEILKAGERAGAQEIENAEQIRTSGGTAAKQQIKAALFLASDRSNHISGKVISVRDDLKRLADDNMRPDSYTLRRLKT